MDANLLSVFVQGGSFAVLVFIVYYALTRHLPQRDREFLAALEQKRQDDHQAIAAQRQDFIALLQQERQESRAAMKQERDDGLHALRACEQRFAEQLTHERAAHERAASQLATSITSLGELIVRERVRDEQAVGPR